jgi:DNA repair photolyase
MKNQYHAFYNTVGGGERDRCLYPTRLDTYGKGCSHDCSYCYSRSLLDFRGLWKPHNPAQASPMEIFKFLGTLPPGETLRLGGMTDCFQPIERKAKVSFNLILMLNKRRIPYLIVTKGADILVEYADILDKDLAHIQISLDATDDDVAMMYDKAIPISKRIKGIERLTALGFDVTTRLSPYIPGTVDENVINGIQCPKLLVEFLRLNTWVKKWMPGIQPEMWVVKSGGYEHLALEYKKLVLSRFTAPQKTVCEDVPEHYEWFKKNFNHNPEDCCNLSKPK